MCKSNILFVFFVFYSCVSFGQVKVMEKVFRIDEKTNQLKQIKSTSQPEPFKINPKIDFWTIPFFNQLIKKIINFGKFSSRETLNSFFIENASKEDIRAAVAQYCKLERNSYLEFDETRLYQPTYFEMISALENELIRLSNEELFLTKHLALFDLDAIIHILTPYGPDASRIVLHIIEDWAKNRSNLLLIYHVEKVGTLDKQFKDKLLREKTLTYDHVQSKRLWIQALFSRDEKPEYQSTYFEYIDSINPDWQGRQFLFDIRDCLEEIENHIATFYENSSDFNTEKNRYILDLCDNLDDILKKLSDEINELSLDDSKSHFSQRINEYADIAKEYIKDVKTYLHKEYFYPTHDMVQFLIENTTDFTLSDLCDLEQEVFKKDKNNELVKPITLDSIKHAITLKRSQIEAKKNYYNEALAKKKEKIAQHRINHPDLVDKVLTYDQFLVERRWIEKKQRIQNIAQEIKDCFKRLSISHPTILGTLIVGTLLCYKLSRKEIPKKSNEDADEDDDEDEDELEVTPTLSTVQK